jgi:ABC-type phosphate transport system substrate-binding protein
MMKHQKQNSAFTLLAIAVAFSVLTAPAKGVETMTPVVAYGASIAGIAKQGIVKYESESKQKVEIMHEDGMASDSILLAVDGGKADLGISGNSWENLTSLIKEKKIEIKNLSKIQSKVLGQDAVIFITYKGGPKELSKEQLKKLLTGEARSWKDIGGEDVAVQIVIPNNTPATQKTISHAVLDNADIYRKNIKIVNGGDETAKLVASTKGAIGFVSTMTNFGEANRPKHLLISKPVTAFTIGAPNKASAKIMEAVEKALTGK